jgi:hypothetical protein
MHAEEIKRLIRTNWKTALLLVAVTVLAIGWFDWRYSPLDDSSYREVEARILAFEPQNRKYTLNRGVFVVAQAPDGTIGRRLATQSEVKGCRVGDRVKARQKGMDLRVIPESCFSTN